MYFSLLEGRGEVGWEGELGSWGALGLSVVARGCWDPS